MLKNTQVLYFNLPDFTVEVLREDLLPYFLRSNIRRASETKALDMKDIMYNVQTVKSYLSSRMLSLSRDNAKKI